MDTASEKQFDFWLGEWAVTWGEDGTGTNHVTRILDEKIVQENFNGGELHGLSFSAFDKERGLWCQTWVDNSGGYLDFTGEFSGGKMILSRDAIVQGQACKQRMVWFDIESDKFEWNWERSDDNGATWQVKWNIHYARKTT